MWYLAILTPAVLLLLMLLLGRLERWLDEESPPAPARAGHRRWRRAPRPVRSAVPVDVRAGRRLLVRRADARPRRRAASSVSSTAVTTARAGRRALRSRRR
jgi:hypothetical protein